MATRQQIAARILDAFDARPRERLHTIMVQFRQSLPDSDKDLVDGYLELRPGMDRGPTDQGRQIRAEVLTILARARRRR